MVEMTTLLDEPMVFVEQGRHLDHPAAVLDAEGRARARSRGWRSTRDVRWRPRAEGAAAGRLQRGRPARVLRHDLHRRVPPVASTRCGGRCWSTSTPSCSASRRLRPSTPRLLQPERRHGVPARAGGGRRRELRLRGLPDPHADHRGGLHGRGRAGDDGRLPRPADAQDALGDA